MRYIIVLLALGALATLAAACGDDDNSTPAVASPVTSPTAAATTAAASASPSATTATAQATATAVPATSTPTTPPATATQAAPQPETVTVTASGIAFVNTTVHVKTGAAVTATLDNKDAGIPHTLTFTSLGTGTGQCSGPCTLSTQFTAPAPGTYPFRCDVHPQTMTGQLIVDP